MLLGMSKQLVYVFPGFYNKETIVLTILRQIQTPQEVVVWFGCGHEKEKKRKGKLLCFGKQTIWFVTCVGKKQKQKKTKKKMYKRSSGKSPS